MSITQRVTAGLQARGVSVTFIPQGHTAKIIANDAERLATEEHFVYRADTKAEEAELITGLVASIISKRKGRRRATLREVQVIRDDGKAIAYTCVGFV